MRISAFAFSLLFLGASGGAAAAQNWVNVAVGPDKTQYQVDSLNVVRHGAYVDTWQRKLLAHPTRLGDGKRFATVLSRRRDDCAAKTSALLGVSFIDARQSVVEAYDVPEGKVEFLNLPPGSLGITIQNEICAFAGRVAALKPVIPVEPLQASEWITTGVNPGSGAREALARDSIRRIDAGRISLVVRAQSDKPLNSANNYAYRTSYAQWQMDCRSSVSRITAVDFYDDRNQLVDTITGDLGTLEFHPIAPASLGAIVKQVACGVELAAEEPKSAPELSFGTGWLGPKGYLVTASHVVSGVTAVLIFQDGEPIGEAQVVADDPANDVAILKPRFKTPELRPVIPLAAAAPMLGEHVFTLGYPAPDDLGLAVKMTSGEVSSLSGSSGQSFGSDVRLLQTSTPIQPGNSGGPLLDERGRAIGVIVVKVDSLGDTAAQNVNYAVKAGYVVSLLNELPDLGGYRPLKASSTVPGLVADVRKSVFMLVTSSDEQP